MRYLCLFGMHEWLGSACLRCGKTRSEEPNWHRGKYTECCGGHSWGEWEFGYWHDKYGIGYWYESRTCSKCGLEEQRDVSPLP